MSEFEDFDDDDDGLGTPESRQLDMAFASHTLFKQIMTVTFVSIGGIIGVVLNREVDDVLEKVINMAGSIGISFGVAAFSYWGYRRAARADALTIAKDEPDVFWEAVRIFKSTASQEEEDRLDAWLKEHGLVDDQ